MSSSLRAAAVFGMAVAMALSTATAASAGPRWQVQPTQNPGAVDSVLRGVSCVSPTFCVAVGYQDPSSTESGTLIEEWNGSSWSLMDGVDPTSVSLLYGVSCLSTTDCTAVGQAVGSGTLVEAWDGGSWTRVPSPSVGDVDQANLQSVSCVSTTACMAVGSSSQGPLAEEWDGGGWTIVPSAHGFDVNDVSGVSCVTAAHCVAVGIGSPEGGPTAERWNGRQWKLMSGVTAGLWSVSCVNVFHCVAVGNQSIARWDHTTWTTQAAPAIANASTVLYGVTCVSVARCFAVGEWEKNGRNLNPGHTLIDEWDGTSWTIAKTPNPPGNPHDWIALDGVSCSTHFVCAAVGYQQLPGSSTLALVSR